MGKTRHVDVRSARATYTSFFSSLVAHDDLFRFHDARRHLLQRPLKLQAPAFQCRLRFLVTATNKQRTGTSPSIA